MEIFATLYSCDHPVCLSWMISFTVLLTSLKRPQTNISIFYLLFVLNEQAQNIILIKIHSKINLNLVNYVFTQNIQLKVLFIVTEF